MSRLGLFSTVPRNQMVAIDRNFREFRGYSGSLLVCVCTSIARTCLDLTNGCCRTRLRWRSGTPQSQALAEKCAVPFGWFGASGLGRKRVAKSVRTVVRQGRRNSSCCWQLSRPAVLVISWVFAARGRPAKPCSLLTCYSEVQVHSPQFWRWF